MDQPSAWGGPCSLSCCSLRFSSLVPGALASVDVHDLPGDERCVLEVDDHLDHVADLAHPAERVQRGQGLVRLGRVYRGADDAECEGVDPDAAVRVLGRQRLGDRGQAAAWR